MKTNSVLRLKFFFGFVGFWACMSAASNTSAQSKLDLTSLSSFQTPTDNWQIVGNVYADLNKNEVLLPAEGTGILLSQPKPNTQGGDLLTNMQHGDLDLEMDYMMAKNSNSGIYLQGRYEIQLRDSWSVVTPGSADNGGIYERWNEAKPAGQKGYEGHAPRQNAGRAPGLWQHIKISFQAPRFDAVGRKLENARILRIELNGIIIHENVELAGVTRGALTETEVALGPLRLQGDHGPVAFRNIKYTAYDKPRPELKNLRYAVYRGTFDKLQNLASLPPEAQGTSVLLTSTVNNIPNNFLIKYTGTFSVQEPGSYRFNLRTGGGTGYLKIKDSVVVPLNQQKQVGSLTLPAGEYPFELTYTKTIDWAKPSLGLAVAGPGIREYYINDPNSTLADSYTPILVHAPVNTILRSFVDLDNIRLTHAVNVGSPQNLHYTYDLDKGMIAQVWRGDFLDATPMWNSRGDGSSRAMGFLIKFGTPRLAVQTLSSPNATWAGDTVGSGYRPKGYVLDDSDRPVFRYQVYGNEVTDKSTVLPANQGFLREITLQQPATNLYLLLAEGDTIENSAEGLYLIDDKSYYIRLADTNDTKPIVRDFNGRKQLLSPVSTKISYSILF